MKKLLTISFAVLVCFTASVFAQIPVNVLTQISKAEDELRFDKTLEDLIQSPNEKIRQRAALAAGRIGDERAVPKLIALLEKDTKEIRATTIFAFGEIESVTAADAILKVLENLKEDETVRARAVEAAGKIAAANAKDEKAKTLSRAVFEALNFEARRRSRPNEEMILLGLTAVLRARPEGGDTLVAEFLTYGNPRIRADAANTLSRIRAKNANVELRKMLASDADAVARANAARTLGAAEDTGAFNALLNAALTDKDSRVRVSAIRSLGSLKDAKAADKLSERGERLLVDYKKSRFANPIEKNELLEIATTLGRILPNTNDKRAIEFLKKFRVLDQMQSPETEIAYAKIAPIKYIGLEGLSKRTNFKWQELSSQAQAIGELAGSNLLDNSTKDSLQSVWKSALTSKKLLTPDIVIPDYLRAYAQFKPNDLSEVLRNYLEHRDIFTRATAAELLGEQTASKENVEALKTAFAQSLQQDKDYNDAQLAILSALLKLDKSQAASSLKLALDAPDFIVRRHAAQLIKQNDLAKSFSSIGEKVGAVKIYNPKTRTKLGQILNSNADYVRAVSRKNAKAIITTEKGIFTIEFTPEDAPLTVDNFIKLAKSSYFNNVAIHRVVPNFVMQDGDPRGDGNGGPGWQIRDELNMLSYERGAVGMALSGKDTGGSQWFITHSPQPHLDGGYTIFGRVNETDMKIVDNLVRGDKILRVKIVEGNLPRKSAKGLKIK